jgi:hydrogenase maturation protease
MMHICVIGIGNRWAGDDGVGPEIIEQLRQEPDLETARINLLTMQQPGLALLDIMEGCDVLMIVDAILGNTKPGTIHRLVWQPDVLESRGIERASSHGFGVREVLNLALSLGRLPPRIILWGIEIASTQPGAGLSPPVTAALPEIISCLRQELESY